MSPEQDEGVPAACVHVPLVVAPAQQEHIPCHTITSTRRCAWAPFCKFSVSECDGTVKARCKDTNKFKDVSDEELRQAKRQMRNKEKITKYQQSMI